MPAVISQQKDIRIVFFNYSQNIKAIMQVKRRDLPVEVMKFTLNSLG